MRKGGQQQSCRLREATHGGGFCKLKPTLNGRVRDTSHDDREEREFVVACEGPLQLVG